MEVITNLSKIENNLQDFYHYFEKLDIVHKCVLKN